MQHAGQTVHVASSINFAAVGLLRTHVPGGTQDEARTGESLFLVGGKRGCYPEIGDNCVSVGNENVVRLDVPMNDTIPMRVIERVGNFARQADGDIEWDVSLSLQPRAQTLAFQKRHHIEQVSCCLSGIVQRQDVGMREPRGDSDFPEESLGERSASEFRVENLDGNPSRVLQVLREEHNGHAPAAELALKAVPVSEFCGQLLVAHCSRLSESTRSA